MLNGFNSSQNFPLGALRRVFLNRHPQNAHCWKCHSALGCWRCPGSAPNFIGGSISQSFSTHLSSLSSDKLPHGSVTGFHKQDLHCLYDRKYLIHLLLALTILHKHLKDRTTYEVLLTVKIKLNKLYQLNVFARYVVWKQIQWHFSHS